MHPRVLMVICQFPPCVLGGAEKMAETFARTFQMRGLLHQVVTSTTGKPVQHPDLPVDGLTYPKVKMAGSLVYLLRLAAHLVRHRRAYDVIYLGLPKYEVILCALLGRWLRKALVVKFESATWERQDNPIFRIRFFGLYLRALRQAAAVVVLSEAMKTDLVQRGVAPDKIRVIPNAVDTQRFCPAVDREKAKAALGYAGAPLIVYLGRLVKTKGVHELVEAFAALVKQGKPAHLLMLGEGPEEEPLRGRIRELGLEHRVTLTVSDDPSRILPAADLFVLPSYSEGVSCALLEAMASGVCAVTTPVGGSVEVICDGENGCFVAPRDADALTATLGSLLDHHDRREAFALAGRASVVDRYDLQALADQYEKLFSCIAHALPGPHPLFSHPTTLTQTPTKGAQL